MMFFQKLQLKALLTIFILSVFSFSTFSQEQPEENKIVSIIGTGDIMLGSNYPSDAQLPPSDGKELLREVKDILKDADVTFGNLEGCFLDKGGNVKKCKGNKCYFFRMPERYVNYLLEAGYDVMNIANDHMGDFGTPGRQNTVKVLKNAGINYAGLKDVCETSRFEIDGVKYGFVGFAPNAATVRITDIEYAKQLVSELDKDCDIVIVSFHGGAEGKNHNRVTRKTENYLGENRGNVYEFAHAVIDAGADVVFGHGPHVVRATELYKDRFIAYSLGNFCTAGEFNVSGISGYAPMVKVFTDKTGKFIKGEIISALQNDKKGPVLDPENKAAKEIKRLTESDFPETDLFISEDGKIIRKQDQNKLEQANLLFRKIEDEPEDLLDSENFPDLMSLYFDNTSSSIIAQNIIEFSRQFLGKPYRRGSKGPNAFDCSGFTSYVFKNFGYQLGAACVSQVNQGVKVGKEELKKGDLIFFKGRNAKSSRVGHVGIVVENDGAGNLMFIHASRRGVIIENLNASAYYKPRYVTGLRVL
ncbi:MAG: CapA family protein [Bacteroidales bacterium]|nr:CapA family protein [Bacteroidales bacterium]